MINSAACMLLIENEIDKKAFEQLVSKYEKRLHNAANNILKSDLLAEEAVWEAFFRIAKCFQKINDLNVHELEAYLIVTIKNVCYQMYNKEKNNSSDFSLDEDIFEPSFDEFNKYDYNILKSIIAEMDEKYRNALLFTYFYGMNAAETADAMGVSRRTVYNYIDKARKILIEQFGDDSDE